MGWGRRPKYKNTKVEYDGLKFDSKLEKNRYVFLRERESIGEIRELVHHPKFPLVMPNGKALLIKSEKRNTRSTFTPDFSYYLMRTTDGSLSLPKEGLFVVEDAKSPVTAKEAYFRFKRAVWENLYDMDLELVFKADEWKW